MKSKDLLILKKRDALESGIMSIVQVIKSTEEDVLYRVVWSSEEYDNSIMSFVKETRDDPEVFWTYYNKCLDKPEYCISIIFEDWRNIK